MTDTGNNIILSNRWFQLPKVVEEHTEMKRLKTDLLNLSKRVYTVSAGRRSFKTERFLKRLFVHWGQDNVNERLFLGSPTRQQSKEIFWLDVKQLSNRALIKRVSEVDLKITYKSGSTLQVVGLAEFKRQQGGFAHKVGITEYQDCDEGLFTETFQPMLNDVNGIFIGEGRPFGKNHFYDNWLKGKNGVSGYGSYHWKSQEILSVEQIENAKNDLAELDYLREYDASFDTMTSVPYYAYSEKNHCNYQINPEIGLIVACDFNSTNFPMSWAVGQFVNGITYWIKTLCYQFTNTERMCKYLDDYFKELFESTDYDYPRILNFYGDYSGNAEKSNSSYTDWEIIEAYFSPKVKYYEKNVKQTKSIRNSIGATNAQLCNMKGTRRQFLNPETCKELVRDFSKAEYDDTGRHLKEVKLIGHICRAVDYYNDYEFSLKGQSYGGQYPHWRPKPPSHLSV